MKRNTRLYSTREAKIRNDINSLIILLSLVGCSFALAKIFTQIYPRSDPLAALGMFFFPAVALWGKWAKADVDVQTLRTEMHDQDNVHTNKLTTLTGQLEFFNLKLEKVADLVSLKADIISNSKSIQEISGFCQTLGFKERKSLKERWEFDTENSEDDDNINQGQ